MQFLTNEFKTINICSLSQKKTKQIKKKLYITSSFRNFILLPNIKIFTSHKINIIK